MRKHRGRVRVVASAVMVVALASIFVAPPAAAGGRSDSGPPIRTFSPDPNRPHLPAAQIANLSYVGTPYPCTPQKVWSQGMQANVVQSLLDAMADKEAQAIRNYAAFGVPAERVPAVDRVIWFRTTMRTNAEQHCLRSRLGNRAAIPGRSTHEFGIAVDIEDYTHGDDAGYLIGHGWCRTVRSEPWHYEHRPSLEFFGLADRCIK